MYRSFTNNTPFSAAGQHRLRPVLPLTIIIPDEDRVLAVALTSSSNANGTDHLWHSNPHSAQTGHFVSRFYDTEETDDEWDDRAQYLSISPLCPRSLVQPISPSFGSNEAHPLSFSCDAVNDDIDTVAQKFHDELARLSFGLGGIQLDFDCLKELGSELGSELVNSPIRLYQDTFFQTMRRRANSALPPVMAPENISTAEESESSDDHDELCFGDSEDDEDQSDTEEGVAPIARPNVLYGLNPELVAPFNEQEKDETKSNSPFKLFRRKRH